MKVPKATVQGAAVPEEAAGKTSRGDAAPTRPRWRWRPLLVLENAACAVIALSMLAGAAITLANIVRRELFGADLFWVPRAGVWMLVALAFIGGAVGYRRKRFVTLDWLGRVLPERFARDADAVRDGLTLVLALVLTWVGWSFARGQLITIDEFLHITDFWVWLPMPVGAALLVLFSLERILLTRSLRTLAVAAAAVALAVVVVYLLRYQLLAGASATTCIIVALVVLALLIALGLPLPYTFGLAAILFCYVSQAIPITLTASDMTDGLSNFNLVAIPFFLFTGFLMSAGRLSDRLAQALHLMLRRVPGGLLHVILASMFVFSGISGSKAGDMAAVGQTAVRMAEQEQYPIPEAVATLCAGAAMGDTIPPSIALIVLGSISSLSVGALFIGGILPACVLGATLMITILLRYRRRPVVTAAVKGRERMKILASAAPVTLVPILLIGGIVSGVATPTEISACAVVLAIALTCGIYRRLSLSQFAGVAVDSAVLTGTVLMVVTTATLFGRVLTLAQVPQDLASWVASGALGGRWGFFFVTAVLMIIMGMVMEGVPALLVFAPLLLPVASGLGINPLQYGIVLVMGMGIGAHSPPIGAGVYVASQIGGTKVGEVGKRMRPFLLALYAGLVIVICVPSITTWLPDVLHVA